MSIKFDKRNYRKHNDKNKDLINKSLKECGAGRSIVIDNEDNIIAGNGIFEQAQKLGLKTKVIETDGSELVVVKRTDLATDDDKRKQLAVMDNSTSDSSEFDFELLNDDFDTETLEDWGIDADFEIEEEEKEIIEDDVPETVETRCKQGDIWQLGEHRLMCGDSTKVDDVEKLMNGEKADMILSDPPYGMHLNTDFSDCVGSLKSIGKKNNIKGNKYNAVIGDNDDFTPELINTFWVNFNYVKEVFLFGADYYAELLPNKNDGSWIVWDKRKESQADAIGSEFELIWSKNKHKRRMLRFDWFGFSSSKNPKEARNRVHPTQKPTSLLAEIIKQWGKNVNLIVDLFGGSGSTLIACEQLNRKCYTMELDEHYCDVIITRWENLTGKKAIKL
jgi:DNA modification methylase